MALDEATKAKLTAAAQAEGVDPGEVIAAAEALDSGGASAGGAVAGPSVEQPKLYQYHLPFIRVRELRKVWLGLDESIEDDEMLCGEFALKHGGVQPSPDAGGTAGAQ